jgi:hypothetical protein
MNGDYPGLSLASSTVTTASTASPNTSTFTIPSAGVWLVTVYAKVQGSLDQMMTGTFLVNFYDGINDTLLSTQLGSTAKSSGASFGLNTLALSNPTSGGVVTTTATWTDGQNHPVIYVYSARLLSAYS